MDKYRFTPEMKKRAESIAETIQDNILNKLYSHYLLNGGEHVLKWVSQYKQTDWLFILQYTDEILKLTYLTKDMYNKCLTKYATSLPDSVSDQPRFLDIQSLKKGGKSQSDMINMLNTIVPVKRGNTGGEKFVYLDDVVFTGNTVRTDLEGWITDQAPHNAELSVVCLCGHTGSNYYATNCINKSIAESTKNITFDGIKCLDICYENRRCKSYQSDVLWPTKPLALEHGAGIHTARDGFASSFLFDTDENRCRYERIMVEAGIHIRSLYDAPPDWLKPLGFSAFAGLGFGGLVVTWRNCPNNVPLAFWWSQRCAGLIDSFKGDWYPLFIREKY